MRNPQASNNQQVSMNDKLLEIYNLMWEHWGNRGWWPAETKEEIVIGAILVQNVSWSNVEKAMRLLKERGICSFQAFLETDIETLHECIRSTRFYKSKAKKLTAFAQHLQEQHSGSLEELFQQENNVLRVELLQIYGIGPETADDIVLYAAHRPTFVIDTYTRRIFARVGLLDEGMPYEDMRQWFLKYLPTDVPLLNQYHALLDAVGHHHCFPKNPNCNTCPLQHLCTAGQERLRLQL